MQISVLFVTMLGSGSYWLRLIFAAIVLFGVAFTWVRKKQYPILFTSIAIDFGAMFFPQGPAIFDDLTGYCYHYHCEWLCGIVYDDFAVWKEFVS